MRCPHCAGEILDGSRFCGICGRPIEDGAGLVQPESAPGQPPAPSYASSPSLFELPVSRKARLLKVFAVLALDLVLAGAGITMIVSYLDAREQAGATEEPAADAGLGEPEVQILEPTVDPAPFESAAGAGSEVRPASPQPSRRATPRARRKGVDKTRPAADRSSPPPAPERADPPTFRPEQPGSQGTAPAPPRPDNPDEPEADEGGRELLVHRVATVVNKNQSQFQRCYRQVAKASGPVQGKVVIRFQVMPDGRATGVRATSNETKSDRLAACLVAQFESWSFPTHAGPEPIDFLWPILFKAPQ